MKGLKYSCAVSKLLDKSWDIELCAEKAVKAADALIDKLSKNKTRT